MTIHLTVKTNQEAFDTVKAHLSTMPKRAAWRDTCLYCTRDGQRCAVGALLDCSDDEARELPTNDVAVLTDAGYFDVGGVNVWLLRDLQRVHDARFHWSDDGFVGHDALRRFAKAWGLTP